jgi:glyoxylase-like metal-dependent hydrolase (beta-lactamase superfamily II)
VSLALVRPSPELAVNPRVSAITFDIEDIEGSVMAVNSCVGRGPRLLGRRRRPVDTVRRRRGPSGDRRRPANAGRSGDHAPRHVDTGERVTLGALSLTVRDLGAGESHADCTWELDDGAVFAGDVVYNRTHAFLADGHYSEWIDLLDPL